MKKIFLTSVCLVILSISVQAKIWYVSKNGMGDGSKNSPLGTIEMALSIANEGDSIYISAGEYSPMSSPENDDAGEVNSNNAFVMKKDVKLFGGFAPVTWKSNPKINVTILSGDLGYGTSEDDSAKFYCYHVVISSGDVGTASLNDITIINGNATGDELILVNGNLVSQNCGGGMYIVNSSPALNNVRFVNNHASMNGGGIYISGNSSSQIKLTGLHVKKNSAHNGGGIYISDCNSPYNPILTNVLICDNTAVLLGGGFYDINSSPIFTNLTIAGNNAYYGGAIYSGESGGIIVRNSIIYNNTAVEYPSSNSMTYYQCKYSLVQGITISGINSNISQYVNPEFVNAEAGDYSITRNSPLINKGNPGFFDPGLIPDLSHITQDTYYNKRFTYVDNGSNIKTYIDIGAFQVSSGERMEHYPVIADEKSVMETNLELNIYPNPVRSDGELFLSLNNQLENFNSDLDVKLYSYDGKLVYEKRYSETNFHINISGIKPGLYLLQVVTDNGMSHSQTLVVN